MAGRCHGRGKELVTMKVCIIGHTERNYLPYMEKYVQFFEKKGVDYDIICWQREEKPLLRRDHQYDYFEEAKDGTFNKMMSYIRYRRYIMGMLQKNRYDKIIVLTTVPALFLKGYLRRNYRGRYLFDFRDYSHEKFAPYRKAVEQLIADSEFSTISSHGFMEFLTESPKLLMNHNITYHTPEETAPDLRQKQVINIGFIGGVRYYEENAALIERLKNTFRYQLWYIGKATNDCDLQGYCAQHEVTNVSFVGKYDNAQKPELYRNIDIINSIYGDDSLEVTTALPNRLYEACLFKKPIISSKGTYLGDVIERYNLGLVVDVEKDDVLQLVNDYVDSFDREDFVQGCNTFLKLIKTDEEQLVNALVKFVTPASGENEVK